MTQDEGRSKISWNNLWCKKESGKIKQVKWTDSHQFSMWAVRSRNKKLLCTVTTSLFSSDKLIYRFTNNSSFSYFTADPFMNFHLCFFFTFLTRASVSSVFITFHFWSAKVFGIYLSNQSPYICSLFFIRTLKCRNFFPQLCVYGDQDVNPSVYRFNLMYFHTTKKNILSLTPSSIYSFIHFFLRYPPMNLLPPSQCNGGTRDLICAPKSTYKLIIFPVTLENPQAWLSKVFMRTIPFVECNSSESGLPRGLWITLSPRDIVSSCWWQ